MAICTLFRATIEDRRIFELTYYQKPVLKIKYIVASLFIKYKATQENTLSKMILIINH